MASGNEVFADLSTRLFERDEGESAISNVGKMKRELTRESLGALLSQFDSNPERAAEKYELMRSRLVTFFECRGCAAAFDLTDATVDRVARRILEGENIPSAA